MITNLRMDLRFKLYMVTVMMDNVSRLTMLKRSILRHSGRKTSNCHAILHDESSSSESAARWLENLKRE